MSEMTLFDDAGNRLYLNADERAEFLRVAKSKPRFDRTFCEALHYTGCRISEALEMPPARVDLGTNRIAIRSLKKRKDKNGKQKIIFRSVPVPSKFIDTLDMAHGIREAQKKGQGTASTFYGIVPVNGAGWSYQRLCRRPESRKVRTDHPKVCAMGSG